MCESSNSISMNIVSCKDIQNLLAYFAKNTYRAKETDGPCAEALERCVELMKTDYRLFIIGNSSGDLCGQYPSQIIILEYENSHNQNVSSQRMTNTIYESIYDAPKLRDLMSKARNARCRARFPVPVIMYKGKYVCRSATLSGGPEIYGRSGFDYLFSGSTDSQGENVDTPMECDFPTTTTSQSDWQLFDRVRSQDIKLLKRFNIGTIVDFMVEKKKVKFGMNVTSSEKVDKENRYGDFKLISLPYPGCEFFKEYRDNNYAGEGLIFDWSQTYVDAEIFVPEDAISAQIHVDWKNYKSWDLVQITQNYLKLLLKYLQEHSAGLLIHCISGWDRTPLFVSLLRLSLWADGLAHQALDAQQILYLTIAYDWMLFGHHLADRLDKGEDIFFFCFYMLKHLTSEEFSVAPIRHKSLNRATEKTVIRTDSDSQLDSVMLEQDPKGSNVSLNSVCSSVSTKSQDQHMQYMHNLSEDCPSHDYVLESYIRSVSTQWDMPCGVKPGTNINRSPQARRTSPVTVPLSSRLRQRQESSSSISIGSWQMISGTGSLRGSDTTSDSNGINNDCTTLHDSSNTLVDEDTVLTYNEGVPKLDDKSQTETRNEGPSAEPCSSTQKTSDGEGTQKSNQTDKEQRLSRKKRLLKVREIFYSCYAVSIGLKFKDGAESSLGSLLGNIAEKVGFSSKT